MTETITALLLSGFFIAGFLVGKHTDKLDKALKDIKATGWPLTGEKNPHLKRVGAIPTPTQQDIYLRDNPKIKEETEAMSEVFGSLGVDKVRQ